MGSLAGRRARELPLNLMDKGVGGALFDGQAEQVTPAGEESLRPTLLFLVTEDWYFNLHRIPLADGARHLGLRVVVAARDNGDLDLLARRGFVLEPLKWRRGHFNLPKLLLETLEIRRLYRRVRPDMVHQVAMKPSLIGSLAAIRVPIPGIVNNLAGLGQAFSRSDWRARLMRLLLRQAFRFAFRSKRSITIVENPDDYDYLRKVVGIEPERLRLIRGVGVNTGCFVPAPPPSGRVVVTMVSRMLWHKGVADLVEAARLLRGQGADLLIRLVGDTDEGSQAAVPAARLREWHQEGVVEWLGFQDDIDAVWRDSHIAVLPSYYREGIPRSLLEAAACGRPIITTDMPGCREIVRHGLNGLLVPIHDPQQLAAAIAQLAADPAARQRMGHEGRRMVEQEFGEEIVVAQTLELYERFRHTHPRAPVNPALK